MKPEYVAYRDELIEQALSRYRQPRETISIPYMLKGLCGSWSTKFADKFPELRVVEGFFGNSEHLWCVDTENTIVDPTVWQFIGTKSGDDADPSRYRVLDEEKDKIFLGTCMNCSSPIYGLKAEGPQSVCPDLVIDGVLEQSCRDELEIYYNGRTSRSNRG